jgi:hypothetical protein
VSNTSGSSPSAEISSAAKSAKRLPGVDHDAASYYMQEAAAVYPGGWGMNPRMRLKPTEEKRVLQTASRRCLPGQAPSTKAGSWQRLGLMKQIDQTVPACPVPASYISSREEKLQELVIEGHSNSSSRVVASKVAKAAAGRSSRGDQVVVPAYPLKQGHTRKVEGVEAEGPRPLEKEMHEELQHSWEVYHGTPKVVKVLPEAKEIISVLQV